MEKKLEELKVVLERLVLPSLPGCRKLFVKRDTSINGNIYTEILTHRHGICHGDYYSVVASINIGQGDWFFECKRYELPTVIAATELVDIAVEKVLGMSCGYEMRK